MATTTLLVLAISGCFIGIAKTSIPGFGLIAVTLMALLLSKVKMAINLAQQSA